MTPQPSRRPREWMTDIYLVITPGDGPPQTWDVEVLDERPTWDWAAEGSFVRLANVNGGDSVLVRPDPPATADDRAIQALADRIRGEEP